MKYIVKLAGVGSVITEKVEADSWQIMDGVVSFRQHGQGVVLAIGAYRLISIKPEPGAE